MNCFREKNYKVSKIPTLTIGKSGSISFNNASIEKWLKEVTHVQLLFDADGERIGVKPVSEDAEHTYLLRLLKGGGRQVSGSGFLKYYSIPHDETRRLSAEWDERAAAVVCSLVEEKIVNNE